jgi:hypothetical protein
MTDRKARSVALRSVPVMLATAGQRRQGATGAAARGLSARPRGAVLRLLRGSDLEVISRELGVTAELKASRDAFLAAGGAPLQTRPDDGRDVKNRPSERRGRRDNTCVREQTKDSLGYGATCLHPSGPAVPQRRCHEPTERLSALAAFSER